MQHAVLVFCSKIYKNTASRLSLCVRLCVHVPVCVCLCACSCVQDGQCHGAARYNPSCGLPRGETAVPAPPRQGAALPGQDRQERVQGSGAGAHLLRDGRGEEESAIARERDGETGAKQEVD